MHYIIYLKEHVLWRIAPEILEICIFTSSVFYGFNIPVNLELHNCIQLNLFQATIYSGDMDIAIDRLLLIAESSAEAFQAAISNHLSEKPNCVVLIWWLNQV